MVNLRYHIVSLTAVFLALGIGLVMGSSFLSDFAVASVRRNLDSAEERIADTRAENSRLSDQIEQDGAVEEELLEAGSEELFRDRLDGVPVLVVATDGTDGDSLDDLRRAIAATGADFEGTMELTGRMALQGDAAGDLSRILGMSDTEPSRLWPELAEQLSTVLLDAASGTGSDLTPPDGGTGDRAEEPELLTALRDGGFIDVVAPPDGDGDVALLTGSGYRYVFVSGAEVDVANGDFFQPLVQAMAADAPAPVVVASAATGDDPEAVRDAVVGPIRSDDDIAGRVSTVDHLEEFAGVASTILALDRLGGEGRGHFGVGADASAAVPPSGS